jgi:SAM-dependent methyltransferase
VDPLHEHRDIWKSKPVLRRIYRGYYRKMAAWARPGKTLEIGGGTGNLKEFLPDIVATDIQYADWLDTVADAQRLPFRDGSFQNVVMFDVLHHLERPRLFLAEAARVLVPGGRVIVMEPGITPLSRLVYGLFHQEPVDMSAQPLVDGAISLRRDPYEANQAIPTLLLRRDRRRLERDFPMLRVDVVQWSSLFAYPLSGGFKQWTLIPEFLVDPVLKVEDWLLPLLGPVMAFRLLGVLERI